MLSLQVVLQAAVGRGYAGDIAVDDVTFTDGLCGNGNESQGLCLISSCDEHHTMYSNQLQSVNHIWRKLVSDI